MGHSAARGLAAVDAAFRIIASRARGLRRSSPPNLLQRSGPPERAQRRATAWARVLPTAAPAHPPPTAAAAAAFPLPPDFGCAQACPDECSLEGLSGTPVYMAPEVARGGAYGPASDLWGVGIMAHQLLTGCFPYSWGARGALRAVPTATVLADAAAGAARVGGAAVEGLSEPALGLMRALLEADPHKRIGAAEALRHPWFAAFAASD